MCVSQVAYGWEVISPLELSLVNFHFTQELTLEVLTQRRRNHSTTFFDVILVLSAVDLVQGVLEATALLLRRTSLSTGSDEAGRGRSNWLILGCREVLHRCGGAWLTK